MAPADRPPCRPPRKPDRLTRDARKAGQIKALPRSFQHHPSNIARLSAREWLISAISHASAELEDPAPIAVLEQLAADQAAGRKAKSLRPPPPQHGAAAGQDGADDRRAAISTRQNMPEPQNSAAFEAIGGIGSKLEPVWNRFGTTNPLFYRDKAMWFQSSTQNPSRMCARAYAQACTRITRGLRVELLEPPKKARISNGLMVPAVVPAGSAWNRSPGPDRCRGLACQLHGLPTGRGQERGEREASAQGVARCPTCRGSG